jgi:hypothetical protein
MGHSSQLWKGTHIIIYGGWNGAQVLSDVIFIDLRKGIGKNKINHIHIYKSFDHTFINYAALFDIIYNKLLNIYCR